MKLYEIITEKKSREDRTVTNAPPVKGGETVSTAQAAKILGVTMSRIRQLIMDDELKPVVSPRKGDRDHELKLKDVQAYKETNPGPGRPESDDDDKDKDD